MAKFFPPKDADEVLPNTVDWSNRLTSVESGDTISTSTWSIVSGGGGFAIDSDSNTTTTTKVILSGGAAGGEYELLNRIVTAAGYTMDQTVKIKIRAR